VNLQARSQHSQIAILLLLCIYSTAFVLPSLEGKPGWTLFLLGGLFCWMPLYSLVAIPVSMMWNHGSGAIGDLLIAITILAWWANPCLWIGLVLIHQRRWPGATIAGAIATFFALLFLPFAGREIPAPGYWLWLTSMVGLLLAAVAGQLTEQDKRYPHFWSQLLESEDASEEAPFEMCNERIRRMEPIDAIHRSAGPGL
jgi:hypothetical protein